MRVLKPVLTFEEACENPQVKERGLLVNVQRDDGTNQLQIGSPFKSSVFNPTYEHVGVKPGTNTKEVLFNLGFDAQTINQFIEKGVIRSVD
ncbi:hypothetical protein ABWK22_14570 [Gottfriedia acidiceleris]|uniref:hypothetical protein n=1 Tax=Gottfriedia acidiceleris TaxID=371036 RepID=UPI0033977135